MAIKFFYLYNYQVWLLVRNGSCNNLKYTSLGVKTGKATDFCVGAVDWRSFSSFQRHAFHVSHNIHSRTNIPARPMPVPDMCASARAIA